MLELIHVTVEWKLNFWIEGVVDESEGKISLFI